MLQLRHLFDMEKNLKKAKTLEMCTFHSCKMNYVILFGSIVQCCQGKQCATYNYVHLSTCNCVQEIRISCLFNKTCGLLSMFDDAERRHDIMPSMSPSAASRAVLRNPMRGLVSCRNRASSCN